MSAATYGNPICIRLWRQGPSGYAGLLALAQNPRHIGGGRGQQADLILGRAVLPARTDHLYPDTATGQLDDLAGKLVAQARGQYLVGDLVAERGDGIGKTVIKEAYGLQPGDLRLNGRQVRAQRDPVSKLLALGLKRLPLVAGRDVLKIGGVFPGVGLQRRNLCDRERLGGGNDGHVISRHVLLRRIAARAGGCESATDGAGEGSVVQLDLLQTLGDWAELNCQLGKGRVAVSSFVSASWAWRSVSSRMKDSNRFMRPTASAERGCWQSIQNLSGPSGGNGASG
jgi:hypothetical protein